MTNIHYKKLVTDNPSGDTLNINKSAEIRVFFSNSGSLAQIYEDRFGGTLKSNPFNAVDGVAEFYVAPGIYDVRGYVGGELVFTDDDVLMAEESATNLQAVVAAEFETVSAMISGSSLNLGAVDFSELVGRTVKTVWNNTTSKKGGAEYVIWTLADYRTFIGNGGWVPDGYGDHYVGGGTTYVAILDQERQLDPLCFGLIPNSVSTNSSPVLNAFFNYSKKQQYSYAPNSATGYVFMRATLRVKIPTGVYAIGETVTPTNEDGDVDFGDSVFVPHSSYDPANWAMDAVVWSTDFKGLRFSQFTSTSKVLKLRNNNADSGIITLRRCNFGGSGLYEIDCRSSIVEFKSCRIDRVTNITVTNCDKLRFVNCWINPPQFTADEQALFTVLENTPIVEFDGGVFVPRAQTQLRCAMVEIGTSATLNAKGAIIRFINVLSGNESNTVSFVNNYAAAVASTSRGARIYFLGGSYGSSSGGVIPAVRLFALPNAVVFSNVDGYEEATHAQSILYFDTTYQTYDDAQAYLTANNRPAFSVHINGSIQNNFSGFPRGSKMMLALRSRPPVTHGSVVVTGGVAEVLPFPVSSNMQRYMAYKIVIINKNNGGAELTAEYVIAGDFAGAITIKAIFEGTSVGAPRLVTSGSTVSIDTNGSTLTQTYAYQLQQIAEWQHPFI